MLDTFFESRERSQRDRMEIQNLSTSYGEEFMNELRRRANDKNLSPRDRKHWRRLLRKAEKTAE